MKRAALVLLCLFLLPACDAVRGISDVEYTVTGVSVQKVSLTYENADGGTSQIASASVPWSLAFKGKRDSFVYISAQIIEGTGSVTVTIKKSGSVFKTSTSSGFASIATASGTLD